MSQEFHHALDLELDTDGLELFAEEISTSFVNRMKSNCCASSLSTVSCGSTCYGTASTYSSLC